MERKCELTSGASRNTNFRDLVKSARLRPFVCATIFARDKSAFLTAAKKASSIGCELAELRIDHLDERESLAQIHEIIKESPLPLIVTCRSQRDGGAFSLSREERRLE